MIKVLPNATHSESSVAWRIGVIASQSESLNNPVQSLVKPSIVLLRANEMEQQPALLVAEEPQAMVAALLGVWP